MNSKLIILFAMMAVALAEETKGPTQETKKDKRGLANFGYGYGLNPGFGLTGYAAPYHGVSTVVTKEVPVPVPHPVAVPVEKHVAVPVKVPYAVPVDRPVPVHIPKPYPVEVVRHVPVPVDRPVAVPVKVPVPAPYAVKVPQPYAVPVVKHVAVSHPYVFEKVHTGYGYGSPYSGLSGWHY